MKFKDDVRLRVFERAWEGTRLEGQALAQAYELIETASVDATTTTAAVDIASVEKATIDMAVDAPAGILQTGRFRSEHRRRQGAALLFAQGGEACRRS